MLKDSRPSKSSESACCGTCAMSNLCLPRGLSEKEIRQLSEEVQQAGSVRAHTRIFSPGDALTDLLAVQRGTFKSSTVDIDGTEHVIAFHLPGELIGLDALHHGTHRCHAEALTDGALCRVPMGRIDELCDRLPSLRRQLMQVMSRELEQRADFARPHSAEQGMARFLIEIAERMGERGGDRKALELSMPRKDIANFLRLTPETVSRVLRRFQDQGWVDVDRRQIRILDTRQLSRAAA